MGPFLKNYGRALALLALLTACERDCETSQRMAPLQAPYDQFFSQLPECKYGTPLPPTNARSSNGLTDSYTSLCMEPYTNYGVDFNSCERVGSERRSERLSAALYGFRFRVEIEQYPRGAHLWLFDESRGAVATPMRIDYFFPTGEAYLHSGPGASDVNPYFSPAPVVTELTNFQAANRTYAQVWRITNPQHTAQGGPTAVTAYFVDRDYGLIRFEQRDGTVWDLSL